MTISQVEVLHDASGALLAALKGHIVVIVDVINMSTTLETAIEAGACGVFGASPDKTQAPVFVNPLGLGYTAGCFAKSNQSEVILVTEPRVGTIEERMKYASQTILGLERAGIRNLTILPNLGAETIKLTDFYNKVVVAVTGSGGVAYDAAFHGGGIVTTATVARTLQKKGLAPVKAGLKRALNFALLKNTGISIVAASSNSIEDVLAANFMWGYLKKIQSYRVD